MSNSTNPDEQKKLLRKVPAVKRQNSVFNSKIKKTQSPFDYLRTLKEFRHVSYHSIDLLAQFSRFETFDSGQQIVTEGEEEGSFGYVIVTGRVSMLKKSPNGRELIVELLGPGDIFGLLLTLVAEKMPAQLSTRALQKTTVLWAPIDAFSHVTSKHPELMKEIVAHLLLSLQSSYCLSRGLAHDIVKVRIAAVLVSLGIKFPDRPAPPGVIEIQFTRRQLADLTGTTPETAIRVTREMEKQELLALGRPGIIQILDLEALQKIVEDTAT